METGYQRGKIQEESLLYERRKHDGSHPIIGVNTSAILGRFSGARHRTGSLFRGRKAEPVGAPERFPRRNALQCPAWLAKLRQVAIDSGNVFEVLIEAVRHCSLGQISNTLYEVGGRYRRSM